MTKDEALKMAHKSFMQLNERHPRRDNGEGYFDKEIQACKEALAENETSSLEVVGFIEGSNLSTNEPDFVGFLYKTQRYGQIPVYKLVNTFEESANG